MNTLTERDISWPETSLINSFKPSLMWSSCKDKETLMCAGQRNSNNELTSQKNKSATINILHTLRYLHRNGAFKNPPNLATYPKGASLQEPFCITAPGQRGPWLGTPGWLHPLWHGWPVSEISVTDQTHSWEWPGAQGGIKPEPVMSNKERVAMGNEGSSLGFIFFFLILF